MNSAMDHAARQGSGQAAANRSVPRLRKSSPRSSARRFEAGQRPARRILASRVCSGIAASSAT